MQEIITKFAEYGYLVVFIYSFGGGMLALAALGVISAQEPGISAFAAISSATIANIIGNLFIFYFLSKEQAAIAPKLRAHRRKIALLVLLFRRNAFLLLLICKFLYGFKTLAPIAAQISRMNFARFCAYTAISCLIWAIAVFSISHMASNIVKQLFESSNSFVLPGVFLALLALIYLAITRLSRKKFHPASKQPSEHKTAENYEAPRV